MKTAKKVVPVRLTAEQVRRIQDAVAFSPILDQSKFIRLAVDWLLMFSDARELGSVIECVVNEEQAT
jgi:hypothetical protein